MMGEVKKPEGYSDALKEAKKLIFKAQEQFLRTANRISMELRLNLGKIVEDHTAKYDWGNAILEKFSEDLNLLFPANTGFSARNLAYMRQFYNEYSSYPDLLEIAKEVSWRTNIVIMTKVK